MQSLYTRIYKDLRKTTFLLQAAVLALIGLAPFLIQNMASATTEDLINREAQVTNATPGASFDITFEFDTTAHADGALAVQGAEFEFVDDPLAGYGSAPSNVPTLNAAPTVSEGGWDTSNEGTAFAFGGREDGDNVTAGSGYNNQYYVTRTDTDDQRSLTDATIGFTGLTHNASANTTFYVRIRLYTDTARTAPNLVWEGAVAQSTSQTLNVSARVQERLSFCVGSTAVNDATTTPGADCTAITGTNVNLGVVDNTSSISPVAAVDGGNNTNGIAFINTNASAGTTVQYAALDEGGNGGKLKVDGTTCTDNVSTIDQCFNSLTSQGALTGESFGMTIGGVNCGSSSGTGYTCDYSVGDTSLGPVTGFIGGGYVAGTSGTYGTGNGFRWDDGGSYTTIAQTSTTGTGTHVIDDEALILRFGAQAALTTPTGQYDVDADFVATPTY